MKMDRRQKQAYDALMKMQGLKEKPGRSHHPWITEGWKIVGADWYDDDETHWCGMTAGRVLKEAGLPILDKGMSVQARAWHNMDWGKVVPLAEAPVGALIVLQHHVAFLHKLVRDSAGRIIGYELAGGNQSNSINVQYYRKRNSGNHEFLSARVWPAGHRTIPKPTAAPKSPTQPAPKQQKPKTTGTSAVATGGIIALFVAIAAYLFNGG